MTAQQELFMDADRAYAFGVTATADEVTFTFHDDNADGGDLVPSWDLDQEKVGALFNALGAWLSKRPIATQVSLAQLAILTDIVDERKRQDEQWGGAEHDDGHSVSDWARFIEGQLDKVRTDYLNATPETALVRSTIWRARMVKVAALAMATIEAVDRAAATSAEPTDR